MRSIYMFMGLMMSVAACSTSSSSSTTNKTATAVAVAGAADAHCKDVVTVDAAACKATPVESDAGADHDHDAGAVAEYGATMNGAEGDDDDCKYHLKWSAAPGEAGADFAEVAFTVSVTTKADGKPVASAPVEIEAFDAKDSPPLNTTTETKETTPGTYVVPVRFAAGASGKWTIRFHIHDDCNDSETSPHGHAAFFAQIDVK